MLNVEENVSLPAVIAGVDSTQARRRVALLLEAVGLSAHRGKLPSQLSGGEQQRAAIARALVMEPAVVLADEPTGNLDSDSGVHVLHLLRAAQRELGQAVVVVTHDPQVASVADEVVLLRDGRIADRLVLSDGDGSSRRSRSQLVRSWLREDRPALAARVFGGVAT